MSLRARTKQLEEKLRKEYRKLGKEDGEASIGEMEDAVTDYYKGEGNAIEDLYDFLERNC